MVIVKLIGGLGNQLFQYAAARRLSLVRNVPLLLDISGFENYQLRKFKLHFYNIAEGIASPQDIQHVAGCNPEALLSRIRCYTDKLCSNYKGSYIRERKLGFDPNILELGGNVYLCGFWQSEKYFQDIRNVLLEELSLKDSPSGENREWASKMSGENSISIHIRRGDYISNKRAAQIYYSCPIEYYQNAIEQIARIHHNPSVYVFSDDIDWVKDNLKLKYETFYMDHNGEEKDYEDLRLMSLCRHHVIANSSFSWWGAWLGNSKDKIVYAPTKWFNNNNNINDIIPDAWNRI